MTTRDVRSVGFLLLCAGASAGVAACEDKPEGHGGGGAATTTTADASSTTTSASNGTTTAATTTASTTSSSTGGGGGTSGGKLDVILAIDNSSSMADKQALLAEAIPDLVDRLVNPRCVDANGNVSPTQPTDPMSPCDPGFERELAPVRDMNIGVITSSLGALGADQCDPGAANKHNDDRGELVSRSAMGGNVSTYANKGFLAWDPDQKKNPPGTSDILTFETSLRDMVLGAGQTGCGYEMGLESIYRFLVDPAPYDTLMKSGSGPFAPTTPTGIDQVILTQRQDLVRPDSVVAIVMLSDENDCSTRVGAQYYSVLNIAPFYRAAAICATDPANTCCYSCGLPPPAGCTPDPACNGAPMYTANEDSVNLSCWHQKNRYGFDALFPTKRYVNALHATSIDPQVADLGMVPGGQPVANPLLVSRAAEDVFLIGIVGVPWQAIAKDSSNLAQGFKAPMDLTTAGFWDAYVGNPDAYVEPTEGIMKEAYLPRAGVTASSPNGGERTINPTAPNDLQYACIYPLPIFVPQAPECAAAPVDNPICQGTTQVAAKAYPGLRQLSVLHGLGAQGVTTSICAKETLDKNANDYGYRPVVTTIIEQVKARLQP